MSRVYNVIDADGHILEPLDLWDKYMDPKYRDRAPRLVTDNESGKEKLLVEGQQLGSEQGMGGIGGVGARKATIKAAEMKYEEGRPAASTRTSASPTWIWTASTPRSSTPVSACSPARCTSRHLAAAMCRAYNRWLADYCKPYPDRLFGIAMMPMQSVSTRSRR